MGQALIAIGVRRPVSDAEELAKELLAPLPERWAHVQAVAARADGLTWPPIMRTT
jgi:hypothetical protein